MNSTDRLVLRIPPELKKRAQSLAEAQGISLSALIKELIDEATRAE